MAFLPYPRHPPRGCSCPSCTNQALVHQHCNPPTESTEFTETSGREEPPTDFTDAHRLGGYGIPAIPTPPSDNPPTEFTEFTEASGRGFSPTDFTDAHRNFWRRRASYRFHRCPQMVRLCRVLWEDSLVAAWVWQECHTLLICAYPCNLWENILRQKFFAICGRIVMLVHVCFVGAAETAAPSCRMQKVH